MFRPLIILAVLVVWVNCEECPPAEDILPCICQNYSGIYHGRLVCSGVKEFDIKGYFDNLTSILDENHIFPDIYITDTDITEVPADAFQSVKFYNMTMEYNFDLKYIHPDAFSGTYETTKQFTFGSNPSLWDTYGPEDVFKLLNNFKKMEDLRVNLRLINNIPDNAMGSHPEMRELQFYGEDLNYLGSKVFSQMPKLEYLLLSGLGLDLEDFAEDAFEGIGSNAAVDLRNNNLMTLPERIFKPLLDTARYVWVGGSNCIVAWCYELTLTCNEEIDWICGNEDYRSKLSGYKCAGLMYNDIFDYCARPV